VIFTVILRVDLCANPVGFSIFGDNGRWVSQRPLDSVKTNCYC
jgi:hypothetical protein